MILGYEISPSQNEEKIDLIMLWHKKKLNYTIIIEYMYVHEVFGYNLGIE